MKSLWIDTETTGLDPKTKGLLTDVLASLELSIILISHELDFISEVADSVFLMENGRLVNCTAVHRHWHTHPHSAHDH